MDRENVFGRTEDELRAAVAQLGLPRYRATQIFYWLYNRGTRDFAEMTDLPRPLRAALAERYRIAHPTVADERRSADGTRKFLLALADGARVEAVLIPSESAEAGVPKRLTLCMSTQVGCPLACRFCATASMKLHRDLDAGEIAGQYHAVRALTDRRITNLVYMGMGEPFLNYEATMRSIEILTHEKTCAVSASRITVSTVGLPDGIRRMADEGRRAKLAISLHACDDALRARLMPIDTKYDLAAVLDAVAYYHRRTRRRVTYEYILFDGVNDGPDDAIRLVAFARRVPSKINLIPFHPIDAAYPRGTPLDLRPSPPERIATFAAALRERNLTVMLRSSSGRDIDAACGQLAVKNERRRAGRSFDT